MHVSSEAGATDPAGNVERNSQSLLTSIKCELKMEVDEEDRRADESQNPTSDAPAEESDINRRAPGRDATRPGLPNTRLDIVEMSGEQIAKELYPVSRLGLPLEAFPKEPRHRSTNQSAKRFRNQAASDHQTGSDRTGQESCRVSWLEASRSYPKQPGLEVDGTEDRNGSASRSNGQVDHASGQTKGIVGRRTICRERSSEELILSTPFGMFHRTPLSFWPARTAALGEESSSAGHYTRVLARSNSTLSSANTQLSSRDRRGLRDHSQPRPNAAADGNEVETRTKVIIQVFVPPPARWKNIPYVL